MPCKPIIADGKVIGIACSRGTRKKKCVECQHFGATRLCDWKLKGKKAGQTCDRSLCDKCSSQPAPDKDLCGAHARLWDKMKAEGGEHASR